MSRIDQRIQPNAKLCDTLRYIYIENSNFDFLEIEGVFKNVKLESIHNALYFFGICILS